MSEQDAAEILRRLRAGMDAAAIVNHVKDGDLLMQLSLAPETRRRYEFPYVPEMPHHLFIADNLYLDSLLYQAALSLPSTPSGALTGIGMVQAVNSPDHVPGDTNSPDNSGRAKYATEHHISYYMPYHTGQMAEPLVGKVTTTPWTRVISDDQLLRRLICYYFYYPHPCGPFVHKDLFLEDMAARQTSFCSPLLVNAMLSIASVRIRFRSQHKLILKLFVARLPRHSE